MSKISILICQQKVLKKLQDYFVLIPYLLKPSCSCLKFRFLICLLCIYTIPDTIPFFSIIN